MPRHSRGAEPAPATLAGLAALLSLALPGCKCEREKPYTPFHIEDSVPAKPSASTDVGLAPGASGSAAPPEFPRQATVAPKGVNRLEVDGVQLLVAEDRVIDRALAADFDGDGTRDAVAWTRANTEPDDTASTGELVFFGGKSPAGRVVAQMPPFVPSGPGCKHAVSVALSGPHTVALDVNGTCSAPLLPRSPTHGLAIVAPAAERPLVVSLRFADPAPGEALGVAVDSRDRDGDGRDDVRVTVTLRSDPADTEASADLVWLDRTAGPSRDSSEPARSLQSLASGESFKQTTVAKMPGRIGNARRLVASLCAESGTARVFDADGAVLPCPGLDGATNALLDAEVRAFVLKKDAPSAAAALGRDGWYGAPLSEKAHKALEKMVQTVVDKRTATPLAVNVAPRAPSGLPRFSPLAFDADGSLLVERADGVSRVKLPDGAVEDATEGVEPWPLSVGAGNAPRWMGVAFPCDRSEVTLLESDPTGTPKPSVPTRLLAPRPGPCKHGGKTPAPALAPLEWTEARQAGWVEGGLFGVMGTAELASVGSRGTPRSPDGRSFVVPWSGGLLVTTEKKSASWFVLASPLSDCVVANGGGAVACVQGERVMVFTPNAETRSASTNKK